jgi:hypothetical protein
MLKFIQMLCVSLLCTVTGHAQATRYIIQLRDKAYNSFSISDPSPYLTQKAILRRLKYNILLDSTDLPVTSRYIDSIRLSGAVTILNTSKWLNEVAIQTTDAVALAKINNFPFVKSTTGVAALRSTNTNPSDKFSSLQGGLQIPGTGNSNNHSLTGNLADFYSYGKSNGQVTIHHGNFLHNHGFRGQGMQLAMLDAGYYHYLTLPTFDSIRLNNQVLGTWDFVNNNSSVDEDNAHGMWCLSTIAANLPGNFVGTAPGASFYLYRTEDAATEYPIEEHFYAAGLERADSLGVEVSSTSLGYSVFQGGFPGHTYAEMDGNTTISARAADFAAKKGMLLIVAAGNEGNKAWHYLVTPSDADSVLSVGAVDSSGNVGAFSSYGPSSDGQVKPGVAAVGWNAAVANVNTGLPEFLSGTSLACPNMAGLATCLWQAFPEESNMGIISALQQSANKFASPDDRVGYGIPDMKKAFVILLKRFYTGQIKQAGCNTLITWKAKNSADMSFEIERKLPSDAGYVSIFTQPGSGSFESRNFNFSDDLAGFSTPTSISYRIKMNISGDTSFYFDPVIINHTNACFTYTFTGNGSWSIASNWAGNIKPPLSLPAGSTIIIDPEISGECILDVSQQVEQGAYFTVMPGKKLLIPGNLITR